MLTFITVICRHYSLLRYHHCPLFMASHTSVAEYYLIRHIKSETLHISLRFTAFAWPFSASPLSILARLPQHYSPPVIDTPHQLLLSRLIRQATRRLVTISQPSCRRRRHITPVTAIVVSYRFIIISYFLYRRCHYFRPILFAY